MPLTKAEKERLTDSRMKIQSVARSLSKIDPDLVPGHAQIETCLEDADKSLSQALRSSDSN